MLPVTRIPDESAARRLARALSAAGMVCEIDRGKAGDWIVWLHEHARLDEARRLQARLAADPAPEPDDLLVAMPDPQPEPAHPVPVRRAAAADPSVIRRTPLTWALLAGCVLTAVAVGLGPALGTAKVLLLFGGIDSSRFAEILHGQVWRLVTPAFVHWDPLHLLFNSLMLLQLGRLIEDRLGVASLAGQVLLYAIISNVAQYLWSGPLFGGMSGVIYGLFGCAWIRGRLDASSGLRLRSDAVFMMLAWFGVCWLGLIPIANMAHTAGLAAGVAWGWAFAPRQRPA